MNRIEATFERLRREGRKGLVGYLTAGDPTPAKSLDDVREALKNGVDVLELGIPFSDPTADGPVIQQAGQRALAAGMTLSKVLKMTAVIRREFPQVPIILFGYANPFHARGYRRLAHEAAAAGADGFLVVDMPWEESDPLRKELNRHDLCWIPLIAPTTPTARSRQILKDAGGFVYYVMVRGVTGARMTLAADAADHLSALRRCTRLPIAAGFGIRDGEQARTCSAWADAVVVGSALVEAARANRLGCFVKALRRGLDSTISAPGKSATQ